MKHDPAQSATLYYLTPRLLNCNFPPNNRFLPSTDSAEELHKAWVAVWLVILLLKGSLVELTQTEGTDKVFRVELLVHGRDTATGDWFVTASTEGATAGVVVRLTVWHTFMVEETACAKHCVALL